MKLKKKIVFTVLLLSLWTIWICSYFFIKVDIKGKTVEVINYRENYKDEGASAKFLGKTLKVETISNINTNKIGEYSIYYKARNIFGVSKQKKRKIIVKDKELPELELKGNNSAEVLIGEKYIEEGYSAKDNLDGDITNKVEVIDKVNYNKSGDYQIIYKVKDSSNNVVTKIRNVHVVQKLLEYDEKYEKIDNKNRKWWSNNKFDHKRVNSGAPLEELKKYNAYFMGPDEKIIYLTYDEGSNNNYIREILKILNKNNVKATFFFCRNFMVMNKNLIKQMEKEGHSIGNHTFHHYNMPSLATKSNFDKYLYEIRETENTYMEITGKQMDKIYREPKGEWSYRSLKIVSDLGYKTFFYSADYLDYNEDIPKEKALEKMMMRYHNGAIYLFHPKNKGNYEALDDFIKNMKALGYKFDLVRNINY